MNIGYHSDFMDRVIERADKRQERMEKMINKMLDKSEVILNAGKPHEMTNEEWFCNLSTEEKARFLEDVTDGCYHCGMTNDISLCAFQKHRCNIKDWLKEIHHAN